MGFHKGIPGIDSSNISSNNENQHPPFNSNAPLEPNSTLPCWLGLGLREIVALYHKEPSLSYYAVWLSPQATPSLSSTCGWPEMLRPCSCSHGAPASPDRIFFLRSNPKIEVTRQPFWNLAQCRNKLSCIQKNFHTLWCWSQRWQLLNTSIRYGAMSHRARGCLMTKQRQTNRRRIKPSALAI